MRRTLFSLALLAASSTAFGACPEFLNHDLRKLHSNESVNLCETHSDKPLLIVNTASHCGFTKQFSGLEALHQKYKDRGFEVVGAGAITVVDASDLAYSGMADARDGDAIDLIGLRLHVLTNGACYNLDSRVATPPPSGRAVED